jgi:NAD-dependent dihydropyrimidine dehydrogenase PreA subunit
MSELVPHKQRITWSGTLRRYAAAVKALHFSDGAKPVAVELANGGKGRGSCLGCHDAPCMVLGESDSVLPEVLSEFPGDPGADVCPTRAVVWNETGTAVAVQRDLCIGCGLCVARCPYGAISVDAEGKAIVEANDPDRLTTERDLKSAVSGHVQPERTGRIGPPGAAVLQRMPETVAALSDTASAQLVRNLFLACGVKCRIRRRGDTNIRMDGVLGTADGRLGVLEIELASAALESPRALLEDVAVLHSRYGIRVDQIDPVSVVLGFPNVRSEYFQVIADIETVLHLRCRTVTVGAIVAVVWSLSKIDGFKDDLFFIVPGRADLLPAMKKEISAAIPDAQPYPGAYRPSK